MSEQQADNVIQFSKPATMIYAWVVTPKDRTRFKAEPRYEATFLLEPDHPDLPAIKAILGKLAKEKFGTTQGVEYSIKDGTKLADAAKAEGKADREFMRGKVVLSSHSNTHNSKGDELYPPRLYVLQNGKAVAYRDDERQLASKFFYSGVDAVPTLAFVAFDTNGKKVTAYLNEVLSFNRGDKIATGVDLEKKYGAVMAAYAGKVSAENPAEGMAEAGEDIPF